MLRYLLVDLDGTLLPVDLDFFFQRYLNALTPHFAHWAEPSVFIRNLIASTQYMVENDDPNTSNEEAFWSDFPRRMGKSREELEPVFTRFYREEFPQLRRYVGGPSRASELLHSARELGMEVILATNPIFPEFVIRERLAWINCADIPFLWVTALENMHYCKPNPKYFQEILDRCSLNPGECLMAGNDAEEDLPASLLGIQTFLVTDFLIDRGSGLYRPDYRGSLEDLIRSLPSFVGRA